MLLLLAGCGCGGAESAGDRLEQAAIAQGLVADPRSATLTGLWERDTDRMCVVGERVGVTLDYGEGQRCAATGTIVRDDTSVRIALGACRFEARFDGDRIVVPADLPPGCTRLCTGRATLAAAEFDFVSASAEEARALRTPEGRGLCGS